MGTPVFHPTDEDLSLGTPVFHPTDEYLSLGTPVFHPTDEDLSLGSRLIRGRTIAALSAIPNMGVKFS